MRLHLPSINGVITMTFPISRRTLLKGLVAGGVYQLTSSAASAGLIHKNGDAAWVKGKMTGAQAVVETLIAEGTDCVFGIPGAQENELWDAMKSKGLGYLLCTHEFSAAGMADGVARVTGKPGVLCVVPGPGVTNSLGGISEALLDSVPLVAVVGDVARGDKYRPFQLHEIPQIGLLKQVTKETIEVGSVADIPDAIRRAFYVAKSGEPGPAAVVVPYNLLIEAHHFDSGPVGDPPVPFDDGSFNAALALLSDRKLCWGIYAGQGCMDYPASLAQVAEILQAPVATSVAGKGVIDESHPLAVGWGYGPQGTRCAEDVFKHVDGVLAIGVRYSEVSTAFYSIPKHKHVIQVDINPNNLGAIVKAEVCVNADAGVFLHKLIEQQDCIRRPTNDHLIAKIQKLKADEAKINSALYAKCGADPMAFVQVLRKCLCQDGLVFVDVTLTEHFAAEAFTVYQPRTYFNPTNNQAMGWSIPAALGAQRVQPGRQTVTVTGDGCFLMSAMEISTAAREGLPVKFFVIDDQAYHLMQAVQKPAYLRTTATILARLDYAALARGFGVNYQQIDSTDELESGILGALHTPGPVLVRVVTDYGKRPVRWIEAVKDRFTKELTTEQKVRFLARIGSRAAHREKDND
jgi:acetolactate synthase-1/2/3 large subunit